MPNSFVIKYKLSANPVTGHDYKETRRVIMSDIIRRLVWEVIWYGR